MMDHKLAVASLVALVVGAGCATGEAQQSESSARGGRTSDGALMRLEDGEDHAPIWQKWRPKSGAATTPGDLGRHLGAFDYWQVRDEEAIREVWSSLFPVLQDARTASRDRGNRQSFGLMLEAIEPGRDGERTRMDLTYVVAKTKASKSTEGVACRLYRRIDGRATPVLTVVLLRRPGGDAGPSKILVWAAPRFDGPTPATVVFRRSGGAWGRRLVDGLDMGAGEDAGERGEHIELAVRLLTEGIWKRFTGNAYVSASPPASAENGPSSPDVDRALGLDVGSRAIDQVYSDTEFPPRADASEF